MEPVETEKLKLYHRYLGASIALKGLHDTISEIQVFTLTQLWPEGSKELDAVSDALEGIKGLIVHRNDQIVEAAGRLADEKE